MSHIKSISDTEYANLPTTKSQRIAEAAKQRELEFLRKRASSNNEPADIMSDENSESAFDDGENDDIQYQDPTYDNYTAAPSVKQPATNQITITLPNHKTEVSLAVYLEGGKQFKLTFTALNVSMNDDCVSILTDGTLHIAPPTLSDIELTLDSVKYNVQYLGGSHKFGAYNQITFIRVEN